jgi:hypothetical protein
MSASPQPIRRVITGHNATGKAIIESDTTLQPMNPLTCNPFSFEPGSPDMSLPFAFSVVHRTSSFPASNTEPLMEYHGKKISLEHHTGCTCRLVDFTALKPGEGGVAPQGFMHRTQSMDFAVVLKGRIFLELDDGVETEVKEGDVVVQR